MFSEQTNGTSSSADTISTFRSPGLREQGKSKKYKESVNNHSSRLYGQLNKLVTNALYLMDTT